MDTHTVVSSDGETDVNHFRSMAIDDGIRSCTSAQSSRTDDERMSNGGGGYHRAHSGQVLMSSPSSSRLSSSRRHHHNHGSNNNFWSAMKTGREKETSEDHNSRSHHHHSPTHSSDRRTATADLVSAMNTRSVSHTNQNSHTARQQSENTGLISSTIKRDSDLVDFRATLLDEGKYRIHKYLLHFEEPDIELGYCQFMYHNSGFYGGKMWHIVALVVTVLTLMFYHPDGKFFSGGSGMLSHWAWIGMDISVVSTLLTTVCLFVPKLFPYREHMYILSLMTHWPSYTVTVFHGKDPHTFTYAIPLACFFFCTYITFARFRNVIFFLSLTPLITLVSVTFGVKDYWNNHSYFEMLIWPTIFPCILTMRAVEVRCRLCYAEVRMAHDQMELTDKKSVITKKMAARFFPPTIAADLLSERILISSRHYPETVLIQSDLEGFTAHSAITEPSEVVQMLTHMFEFIDEVAPHHGVEKLATVGDAYLGVSFPTHPLCYEGYITDAYEQEMTTDPMASEVPLAARISSMISFGCKFVNIVPELRMRVGVAHGSVTAGFIGEYPPKLDVFGFPVQHVAHMEKMGVPGYIHVAQESIDLALTVGATTADGPPSQIAGVLVPGWLEDESRVFTDHVAVLDAFVDSKTDRIMGHLGRFGDALTVADMRRPNNDLLLHSARESVRRGNLELSDYDTVTDHNAAASVTAESVYTISMTHEHSDESMTLVSASPAPAEISTNDVGFTMFHPVLLYFREPEVEDRFKQFLRESRIIQVSQQLLMVLQFIIAIATLGFVCVDSSSNRGIVVITMLSVLATGGYLRFIGTDHRFNMACIWTLYMIPCLACSMLHSDCDKPGPMKGYYAGVAWSLYTITWVTAPNFCIDVRMWVRTLVIFVTCGLMVAMVPIHEGVVDRKDVHADWYMFLATGVFTTVTFFLDYNLRSAFAATVRLRRGVSKSRKHHARVAKKCIDTMLPRFVSDQLIRPLAGSGDAEENGVHNQPDDDEELEINTEHMLWEYPRAVCMFINFQRVDGKDFDVERVNSAVKAMEKIFARNSVQKVKSIQNTVLVVGGISRSSNPQHCAVKMLTAALHVVAELGATDMELRCGLHTGPCFGAVVGNTGLSFDVFGDTVNTASRIQSCAAPNTVQFTKAFKDLLGRFGTRFQVTHIEAVNLKGKGLTELFRGELRDASADAAAALNAPVA